MVDTPPTAASASASASASAVPDDKAHAPLLLVSALVMTGGGFALRKVATSYQAAAADLAARVFKEPPDSRAAVQAQKIAADNLADLIHGVGTALIPLGVAVLIAAVLSLAGVSLRRAFVLVALVLLFVAYYLVASVGIETLIFTSLLGVGVLAFITSERSARTVRAIEDMRLLPTRLPRPEEPRPSGPHPFRSASELDDDEPPRRPYGADILRARAASPKRRLAEVKSLPAQLQRLLTTVGDGSVSGYFTLKHDAAYLALIEADATSLEDYATVVMRLEEPGPRFRARPLPIVEGRRVPNTGVVFKKDPDFSAAYLVEPSPSANPKDVRRFLNGAIRDELYDLDGVWLVIDGAYASATLYGPFDVDRIDKLVELADVFFAEYGLGGESLLDPDDVTVDGMPKNKKKTGKKKRKPASPGASAGGASPA